MSLAIPQEKPAEKTAFQWLRFALFGSLHAHVARQNPLWQNIANGDEVQVVFQVGDAYISPQWYPSKHEFHKQVPTWNYVAVHAYGKVTIRDDERYVRVIVARLTRTHEASQPEPWKVSDTPKECIDGLLKAIVGIEIEITKIEGQAKRSRAAIERLGAKLDGVLPVIKLLQTIFLEIPMCIAF